MDLNHDKQIQSLLCYRYTIGQAGALAKLNGLSGSQAANVGLVNWVRFRIESIRQLLWRRNTN